MVDPRRPAGSVEDDWMTKDKNTTDRVHGLFYLKKKEFLKPLDKGCKRSLLTEKGFEHLAQSAPQTNSH